MNIEQLVDRLIAETWETSLGCFAPELAICAAILALLFARLFDVDRTIKWFPPSTVAALGILASFYLASVQYQSFVPTTVGILPASAKSFFTGLLVFDHFTVFFRLFLLFSLLLVVWLTSLSGIPDREDGPDFYVLLLGATLGMMLMASANHLLMLFIGVEMASVPSYVMVGFLKGRRTSSEAALKYVVYGGGAAGIMLYGISLLSGMLGTAHLPELAVRLSKLAADPQLMSGATTITLVLGLLMILVGLAFKLSIFPFHFWCPDAFEGAPAEVAGFLSVASKGAAFALLVRFCVALVGDLNSMPQAMANMNLYLGVSLGAVAAITATFGNLAAYSQRNIKRMLAYSTIAHAGYMLMAVAAMMVFLGDSEIGGNSARQEGAAAAVEGLLYYLMIYLLMNLGAFAIVAIVRNKIFSEEINDYAGLQQHSPVLAVGMILCMISLVGLPPMGGFWGKAKIFMSLYQAGAYHWSMYVVLVVGAVNTVLSLFYYLNVLRVMWLLPAPESGRRAEVSFLSQSGAYVAVVSLTVLLTGTIWAGPVIQVAANVASNLFSGPSVFIY